MPAKDLFHDAVKNGLVKDGWTITHDPFKLNYGFTTAFVDLAAEKLLAAEKGAEKIAVEVKSFVGKSDLYELHAALGQFISYRFVLKRVEPERILFLAVPQDTFKTLFHQPIIADLLRESELKTVVYNSINEEIVEWIK